MSRNDPIALFDLDGTLADYHTAMKRDQDALRSPGEPEYRASKPNVQLPKHIKARKQLISAQPGWWAQLGRFQLGWDLLDAAQQLHFNIHILTKAPNHCLGAWSQKAEWVQRHLGKTPITISDDKGLVDGRLLVDDWPEYVARWRTLHPDGLVIMPAHSWNEGFGVDDPLILRYDGTNRESVVALMALAYCPICLATGWVSPDHQSVRCTACPQGKRAVKPVDNM